ncbi:hypothetical protein I5R56_07385 [Serratia marcescens]|nr:hypothetical protein [Serratia marcescens]
MDKFKEPEQFDAEVEIHGGEPFAVWAPAVNGSHVKAELYFSLLAELEAKDDALRAIAFHVSAGGYNADSVDSEVFKQKIIDGINSISDVQIKRIAELSRLLSHNIERAEEAEKRLATPVRLPNKNDDEFWFGSTFQVAKFDRAVERAISAAGFKFVGDE